MATARTVVRADRDGFEIEADSWAGSAGGDTFEMIRPTFLYVNNAGAGEHTITVVTGATFEGRAVADHTIAVPAGEVWLALLNSPAFPPANSNTVTITYDASPSELTINLISA